MTADDPQHRCNALSARLDALEKSIAERADRTKERFELLEKATTIATSALDKRLDGMNEFRASLSNQAKDFVPHSIYEVQHQLLAKQIEINTGRLNEIEKQFAAQSIYKAEVRDSVGSKYYTVATAGVLFAVITSFVTVAFNVVVYLRH